MTDRRDRFCITPGRLEAAIASLHLQSWAEVKSRLMVRVATDRHSPIVRRLNDGMWLTVVLPLSIPGEVPAEDVEVVINPSSPDVAAWSVGPEEVWCAAETNTRRLLRPMVHHHMTGPFSITFFLGDRSTSGVAIDIRHFRTTSPLQGLPRTGPRSSWWSLLSERSAVLLSSNGSGSADHPQNPGDEAATAMVGELRRRTEEPFPPNLFRDQE